MKFLTGNNAVSQTPCAVGLHIIRNACISRKNSLNLNLEFWYVRKLGIAGVLSFSFFCFRCKVDGLFWQQVALLAPIGVV
jgi:hypothetical protein